jgi:hypothetical protein
MAREECCETCGSLSPWRCGCAEKVEAEVTVNAFVVKLDSEFVGEVFITALEGGVQCWAQVDRYSWREGNAVLVVSDEEILSLEVKEGEKNYPVSHETVRKGLERIAEGEVKGMRAARPLILKALVEGDAGQVDAGLADCVVQAGIFGEVVYG